jgi:hypothetical protein
MLRVPGLYEHIRTRELTVALSDDPRLALIDDPDERERIAATAPAISGTALGQLDAVQHRQPVRVPRWMLGAEARGWAPYEDRRHEWFWLSADDVLTPA